GFFPDGHIVSRNQKSTQTFPGSCLLHNLDREYVGNSSEEFLGSISGLAARQLACLHFLFYGCIDNQCPYIVPIYTHKDGNTDRAVEYTQRMFQLRNSILLSYTYV